MVSSGLFEVIPCPLCQSSDYEVVSENRYTQSMETITKAEFLKVYKSSSDTQLMDQMVECKGCSLRYLNPRVNADIILESYSGAVDPHFVTQNALRIETFSRSLKKTIEQLGWTDSKGKRFLDIGCAGGACVKAAADLGFTATGVEPSRYLCEWGKKEFGLDLRAGTLLEQKFEAHSFDVITLWDVIEHLTDPGQVIDEVRRLLKKDGVLIVNYPDHSSVVPKLMGKRWPFFLSVHLIYFDPKTITRFLKDHGFHVRQISTHWQTLQLGYVLERASAYFKPFKWAERATRLVKAHTLPFSYYLGQKQVIATRKDLAATLTKSRKKSAELNV